MNEARPPFPCVVEMTDQVIEGFQSEAEEAEYWKAEYLSLKVRWRESTPIGGDEAPRLRFVRHVISPLARFRGLVTCGTEGCNCVVSCLFVPFRAFRVLHPHTCNASSTCYRLRMKTIPSATRS